MRLQVLSDLHLEVCAFNSVLAQSDVVVLAGDLHEGTRGLEWAAQTFPGRPIVHVPGNHEYYDGEFAAVREAMRRRARELGIVHLDDETAVLNGVRFIGATLWADLLLYGEEGKTALLSRGLDRLVEYRCVRFDGGPFKPEHSIALHAASRAFLERALAEPFDGPTVVITHHSPHPNSIHPRFKGYVTNPAFASDLSGLMGKAALWIHGHTHASFDYQVAGTRVLANLRGYAGRHPVSGRLHGSAEQPENAAFDPALTVELQGFRN
jgi:calcineurin-like phosphoesterase family protein